MCRSIENAKALNLSSKTIRINYFKDRQQLSPTDVECMTVFLTCSSHKEWKEINLWRCYIQDQGLRILQHGLTSCDITITEIDLDNNGLTEISSSAISDIIISCRIKVLGIRNNSIVGEDEKLYSIISDPSSMLEVLYMSYTNLSFDGAVKLFNALSKAKKLLVLEIGNCNITNEACDAIIMAVKKNTSLVKLEIYSNPISGRCALLIVQALQHNNTLQILYLHKYSNDVRYKIRLSEKEVNEKRENRKCQVKLDIVFIN